MKTDKKIIEEFLTRGVENVYPTKEKVEEALMSGKQLTIYTGIDPTGKIHMGHGVVFRKLAKLQKMGHRVIFLLGTFTAQIGDPTDKGAARKQLTKEDVQEHAKSYVDQLKAILDFTDETNPVEVKYNSDWLEALNFADVVNLASHFTVQQMLERDMFAKRMTEGKPIHLHEFLYPLMQGFDSVAMDVDMEIGGNDQTFNMLTGRTLLREMKNKEKFVICMELLVDANGKKMSKTDANFIALDDSGNDMFGKVMSWTDQMIISGFRILTDVSLKEIHEIEETMKNGGNPRDAKVMLAYEVVKVFKGDIEANLAKENFESVFSQGMKPAEIETKFSSSNSLMDVLVETGLVKSKSEARRLIEQKGVKVDDVAIGDLEFKLKKGVSLIQKGKRHFVNISVE